MPEIGVDFEARSVLDLTEVGIHQYAQHPSTGIICLGYSTQNGNPKIWRPGLPFPPELIHAARHNWTFVAHNAQCDRTVWKYLLPQCPPSINWLCTATRCSANGLPRGLDKACEALGFEGKDKEGSKSLEKMMCPDRKTGEFIDTPELRADVERYCGIDLIRMWQLYEATKPLSEAEQAFYEFDAECNARGFAVDANLVDRILSQLTAAFKELDLRVFDITKGALGNINSIQQLDRWLSNNGVELPNAQAETLRRFVEQHGHKLDPVVKEVIRLRQLSSAKAHTKFNAFKKRGQLENGHLIMRDTFICNGAQTGRHTSKGMQNLKREMLSMQEMDILVKHPLDEIRLLIGEPLELSGKSVRPTICARPGKTLLIGDFAQIELRTSFWLAGEITGLQKLRDKVDLYKEMAAAIYKKVVEDITKEERQLGKQGVLSLQYGSGASTFQNTLKKYSMYVDLEVCEDAVSVFREIYRTVRNFWYTLEDAVKAAIRGDAQKLGPLKIAANDKLLVISLPSGRKIRYQSPSIEGDRIRYWAVDGETNQWMEETAWGGKIYGHVVQGIANCIQREAAIRLRNEFFEIVFHAYDELVAEDDENQLERFERIMSLRDDTPAWMQGMYVSVDANASRTYRK